MRKLSIKDFIRKKFCFQSKKSFENISNFHYSSSIRASRSKYRLWEGFIFLGTENLCLKTGNFFVFCSDDSMQWLFRSENIRVESECITTQIPMWHNLSYASFGQKKIIQINRFIHTKNAVNVSETMTLLSVDITCWWRHILGVTMPDELNRLRHSTKGWRREGN